MALSHPTSLCYSRRPHLLCLLLLLTSVSRDSAAMRFEYSVSEDVPVGHVIVNLAREFSIDPHSNAQSLQITNSHSTEGARYFSINASTGELVVVSAPDRDTFCEDKEECVVELMIAHGDSRNPEVTALRIRLMDVNDNTPVFPQKMFELKVREEMDPRLVSSMLPAAYDPDFGQNSVHSYTLDGRPEETMPFGVERKENAPKLVVHQKLDRERKAVYNFRMLARDGGRPQRTGTLSIRVLVEDVNDHQPEFERTSYSALIEENSPEGRTILKLKATDKDAGNNGRVGYRMAQAQNREEMLARQYFEVFSSDGEGKVIIKKTVDIDKRPNLYYRFTVIAFDHGAAPLEAAAPVIIRVRDVNDDKPSIKINYLKYDGMMKTRGLLAENEEKVCVALIIVTDRDSGPGGIVSCKVDNDLFYLHDIDRSSGVVKTESKWQQKQYKLLTRQGIDREAKPEMSFLITCHDNAVAQKATTKLVSTARVQLRILDKNDEKPRFSEERYTFYLRENVGRVGAGVQVGQVKAVDKDAGDNAKISYFLMDDSNNAFKINRKNGVIYSRRSFDREHTQQVLLKVKAVDSGSPQQQTATAEVRVNIADVNDNAPSFKTSDYHFTVVENSRAIKIGQVAAVDEDTDANALVEYRILRTGSRDDPQTFFSINRHSGAIHLNSRLDRERQEQYVFNVIAVDKPNPGQQRKTGTATVTVSVLDENDNRPRITEPKNNALLDLDDTDPIGKDVFTMRARDPDEGVNGTVSYSIVRGAENYFSVDKTAGVFYLMRKLEGYHNKLFTIILMARDNGRGISLNSTVTVRIRVKNGESEQNVQQDYENVDPGETGRTLIVVAAIVLLLLVLAAVALLVMLRMKRVPSTSRRSPSEDMKRKWKDGLVGNVTETYTCSRSGSKSGPPKIGAPGMDDEKVDEYLLESPTLRTKDACVNYNSLNFYKGESSPDKTKPYHTYYEVAKPDEGHRTLDNYVPIDRDEMNSETLHAQKSPFLGDMRLPGLSDSEMTVVGTMRRHDKPLTPYIEASFV